MSRTNRTFIKIGFTWRVTAKWKTITVKCKTQTVKCKTLNVKCKTKNVKEKCWRMRCYIISICTKMSNAPAEAFEVIGLERNGGGCTTQNIHLFPNPKFINVQSVLIARPTKFVIQRCRHCSDGLQPPNSSADC